MSPYGLSTKFTVKPGKREEFLQILLQAAAAMKNVQGCSMYDLYKDANDENAVWVTERWESKEAHDASLHIPGAKELIAKALPLLDGRPEQVTLIPV